MLLYEIADDVHWLMLTDVKHIKKSVLCAQGSFVCSLIYEQIADLSLYLILTINDIFMFKTFQTTLVKRLFLM